MGSGWGGGQGGCERRSEKKSLGEVGLGGQGGGGQSGCDRRSEAIVKIKKKYLFSFGGSDLGVGLGGGGRVDKNGEVKFFWRGGGGRAGEGVRSGVWWGRGVARFGIEGGSGVWGM